MMRIPNHHILRPVLAVLSLLFLIVITPNLPVNAATLQWAASECAVTYNIVVKNALTGKKAGKAIGLLTLKYKTKTLTQGMIYKWFVQACNANGCVNSVSRTFKIE